MSEPGHQEDTGIEPQAPGTVRIPAQPSESPEVPAWGQAGASALPAEWFESTEPGAGPAAAEPGAEAPGPEPGAGRLRRARLEFRSWRHRRPFWGGLLVLLGGGEILLTYRAAFGVVLHFGLYGLAGYLVPAILTLTGLLIIFDPAHRTFYSLLAIPAALGTWMTSNLGGFVIGMLLGVVGGSLAFGWAPGPRKARKQRRVRARATG